MITEDYVSFETAKLLKEKGFDSKCDYLYVNGNIVRAQGCKCNWNKGETIFTDYKNECSAPTLQMAMKWLREVYNLFIEIQCYGCEADEKAHFEYSYVISEYVKFNTGICTTFGLEERNAKSRFPSYEEACEAAIKYCLKNLI